MRLLEAFHFVIQRSVTSGNGLQTIEEVEYDFRKRHVKLQLHPISSEVHLIFYLTALVHTKGNHRTHILGSSDDGCFHKRLFDVLETCRIWHIRRSIDQLVFVARHQGLELHRWNRCDDGHVKLPFQSFLYNFHVEHSQKSAAKAEAQGRRSFRLPNQGGVVELQLFHGSTKLLKFGGIYRINSCKNHGLHVFKAFDRFGARVLDMRHRIPYSHFFGHFDS